MNFKSEVQNNVLVVTALVERLDTHSAPELKSVFTLNIKKASIKWCSIWQIPNFVIPQV